MVQLFEGSPRGIISRNVKVSVGASSTRVAEAVDRVVVMVKNTSTGTQRITIVFGYKVAVDYEGIVLEPGEWITDSDGAGYKCWDGVITAISSAAGGQLSVFER